MKIISHSPKETLQIGKIISKRLKPKDVVCLYGGLGAGKTVLTKGIASGLGIKPARVISPTFVLIREYKDSRLPLYHFDLFRLDDPVEVIDLGYEDYFFSDGISVVEWADRLKFLSPKEYLKIELSFKDNSSRLIKFKAKGKHYQQILRKINEDISR